MITYELQKLNTIVENGCLAKQQLLETMLLTMSSITLHQLRVIVCIFYHGMTKNIINNYY